MPAAELVERLRHLRHLRRDDVVPDGAPFGRHRFGDRPVGIDGVAAVDEEQRRALAHRFVDLHPAEGRVDAPPLTGRIATPQETHVGPGVAQHPPFAARGVGRDRKPARHRLADRPRVVQALKRDAHEHLAARLQAVEALTRGVVAGLERVRPDKTLHFAEPLVVRPVDQHARRPVAAAPDHDRAVAGVAEVQALQRLRPFAGGGDDGWCHVPHGPVGQDDARSRHHAGLQKPPTR